MDGSFQAQSRWRNRFTAAAVQAGSSSSGAWPRSSKITNMLPTMSRWKRSASSGGINRSRPPHIMRVGSFSSGYEGRQLQLRDAVGKFADLPVLEPLDEGT